MRRLFFSYRRKLTDRTKSIILIVPKKENKEETK